MERIGDLIKDRRRKLRISIDELSYGICAKSNLSRIENNTQAPKRATFEALMQRLALPYDNYPSIMSRDEEVLYQLRYDFIESISKGVYDEAEILLSKIDERRKLENIYQQLLVYGKGILLAYKENDLDGGIKLLYQALDLSIIKFNADAILSYRLNKDEIFIINSIATVMFLQKRYIDANVLFKKLKKYHEEMLQNVKGYESLYSLVLYNYSLTLYCTHKYEEALEICEIGIKCCKNYDQSNTYPYFLYNKASNLHMINQIDKAIIYFKEAYIFFEILSDSKLCKMIENYLSQF